MKPTIAERNRRVEEVKQLLLQGEARTVILRNISERYGVTERTVENYLSSARVGLDKDLAQARPYMLAEHIAHRRDLRIRFRKRDDLYGELKAAQDEAKLFGLYIERTDVTTAGKPLPATEIHLGDVTDDQLRNRLAALAAATLAAAGGGAIQSDDGDAEDNDPASEGE